MRSRSKIVVAVVEDDALTGRMGADGAVPWWSFTKTVIAAAALKLVQDGTLALDEPLRDRPYTLRQLLQHRAGVVNYGNDPAYHEAVARDAEPWPVPLLLQRLQADRLRYAPGQGWDYSNVGYLLVRQLIEAATGVDLGSALALVVLQPLGIQGARIAREPVDLDGINMGAAASYHPGWVYHGLLVGPPAAGALLLHRLMTGALLSTTLLSEMRRPHHLGGPIPGRPWKAPGYGLGLMSGMTCYGYRLKVTRAAARVACVPSTTFLTFVRSGRWRRLRSGRTRRKSNTPCSAEEQHR